MDEYREQLFERNIAFTVDNNYTENITVSVDLLKLRRVFANIIGNSIRRAKAEKLQIRVTIHTDKKQLQFVFLDNGRGVPDSEFTHVFEPFYTFDKSRRVSGLGLSICKSIVESHHGRITVKNNEKGGLCVIVTLPIDN